MQIYSELIAICTILKLVSAFEASDIMKSPSITLYIRQGNHPVNLEATVGVTAADPTVADLLAAVQQLKRYQRTLKTNVVFSAALSGNYNTVALNQPVVIYDKVYVNIGSGYDSTTGLFTCPVSGYYKFDMSVATAGNGMYVILVHNDNYVIACHAPKGYSFQACSNGVSIKLAKGDVVKVISGYSPSYMYSRQADPYITFNGMLIMTT